MVPQELETLRDWLRFAVTRFGEAKLAFGHGTTNAYDEAAYLLLHALSLPLDRLEPFLDARLTLAEQADIAALLSRRIDERIPAAYLTSEAWLGDFRFHVDKRVVIPRSYIAELLPDGLAPYVESADTVRKALDLCTGSGCLAILIAHAYPNADIDAVEISPEALAVAQHNVSDYDLAGRINLIRSNLFDNLRDKTYDLIITNPPYVTTMAMEELPAEFRHEPELALAGGDDGLDIVRTVIERASRHLNARGVLVVEVGSGRAAVEAVFPQMPFVWLTTRSSTDAVFLITRDDLAAHQST
ncbi:MAG TPA: 50S ribosomal protein L3 N(5)-glutamine methyltransferase [Casimicrobiaceae bacterium]|nr:50S ribosomal protein L3 N(5)-glutamine methyltransferase [Casimicrobiaceae bacterium]